MGSDVWCALCRARLSPDGRHLEPTIDGHAPIPTSVPDPTHEED